MIKLSDKQKTALVILEDNETNELLYGGGAGGAKSFLGCFWVLKMCLKYPGTRYLIGRSVLKTLKETTIKTLFEVISKQQIPPNVYRYNAQTNEIVFYNKSEIIFKDLFSYPSDPNFDELGSLEITGCFIDEAIQVKEKAKNIVKSRIRFNLDKYCDTCGSQIKKEILKVNEDGKPILWKCDKSHTTKGLIPKMLYTSNPGKGWLYKEFYQPYIKNQLPENKKFVQSLLTDNPYISEYYAENLESLDKESKQRLLHGNWDYEADGYVYDESKVNRFKLSDIDISTGQIINYADVADSGIDYFSMPIACIIDHKVYIIDWIYTQKPIEYWMPLVIETIQKYNIQKSFFESNNQGLVATKYLKDKIGKPYDSTIFAIKETSNKHARIKLQAEVDIIPNFYFLSNHEGMYTQALEHLFQYRFDQTFKIDDAPDSLSGLSKQSMFYRSKKNNS